MNAQQTRGLDSPPAPAPVCFQPGKNVPGKWEPVEGAGVRREPGEFPVSTVCNSLFVYIYSTGFETKTQEKPPHSAHSHYHIILVVSLSLLGPSGLCKQGVGTWRCNRRERSKQLGPRNKVSTHLYQRPPPGRPTRVFASRRSGPTPSSLNPALEAK
jgi:hypothetical protein